MERKFEDHIKVREIREEVPARTKVSLAKTTLSKQILD